ncbi:MAG: signal recognition particle-docking protein FtsY [Bacteroidetes bacterium]|nr:signal recognition particle-docking protein FtsY [Bacteroidota bacterium]
MRIFDLFTRKKLDSGLLRTREGFLSRLGKAITGKTIIDEEVLDKIEETLIAADVGTETSLKIISNIQKSIEKEKKIGTGGLNEILKEEISSLLIDNSFTDFASIVKKPYIILVVGVNGVGKTTTIGKLAHIFKKAGKNVLFGAADTFRAAAVEQLGIWAKRSGAQIISQGANADPAAVAFDTVNSAIAKKMDVAIIDTAGRLHNKTNLMNELSKIKRVIQKVIPDAPHEVLLVLDASTGQNAIEQCKQFTEVTNVTALALTKLDGTAKGGVVIGISDRFKIPVKYIGVGEGIDDLQLFDKKEFADSLFNTKAE